MNIQTKQFKFHTIRTMIENNDLSFNLKELNFDLMKHNLKTLPFAKIIGLSLPMIYAIEYDDGKFEIISNSIFIELFLKCHLGTEQNPGELSERLRKINNEIFQICIFNLTKDVDKLNETELRYFLDFQMHAECFNFDEMYVKTKSENTDNNDNT